jgi:hypothetical protein
MLLLPTPRAHAEAVERMNNMIGAEPMFCTIFQPWYSDSKLPPFLIRFKWKKVKFHLPKTSIDCLIDLK